MSVFSDIITDLFKKTVENVIMSFHSYLSTPNIINILNMIISDLQLDLQSDENNVITCQGCLEDQPNQQAHMDIGGCLYDEL
jgi:hypothetical protein